MQSLVDTTDLSARDVLSQSYDGMLVIAMALNASVSELTKLDPPRRLEDFHYGDDEMRDVFMQCVREVRFYGATVSTDHFIHDLLRNVPSYHGNIRHCWLSLILTRIGNGPFKSTKVQYSANERVPHVYTCIVRKT